MYGILIFRVVGRGREDDIPPLNWKTLNILLIYYFTNNDKSGVWLWHIASAPAGEGNYTKAWRKKPAPVPFPTTNPKVYRSIFGSRLRRWKVSALNLFMNSVLIPYSEPCEVLEIFHNAKLNEIPPTM
jgi:hypothetical protein